MREGDIPGAGRHPPGGPVGHKVMCVDAAAGSNSRIHWSPSIEVKTEAAEATMRNREKRVTRSALSFAVIAARVHKADGMAHFVRRGGHWGTYLGPKSPIAAIG